MAAFLEITIRTEMTKKLLFLIPKPELLVVSPEYQMCGTFKKLETGTEAVFTGNENSRGRKYCFVGVEGEVKLIGIGEK